MGGQGSEIKALRLELTVLITPHRKTQRPAFISATSRPTLRASLAIRGSRLEQEGSRYPHELRVWGLGVLGFRVWGFGVLGLSV